MDPTGPYLPGKVKVQEDVYKDALLVSKENYNALYKLAEDFHVYVCGGILAKVTSNNAHRGTKQVVVIR